jgi:hypothetical protein
MASPQKPRLACYATRPGADGREVGGILSYLLGAGQEST